MTSEDISYIALTVLGSIGTAGGIVFGMSSWLGKVWANRLMANERQQHEKELTELRSKLERDNQKSIKSLETDLSIFKDKYLKGFHDKIEIYRLVIDIVSETLGDFDATIASGRLIHPDRYDTLNRARIRAYGYIAMLAPQSVMNAQDELFDHLILIAKGKEQYVWERVRELALNLLNEVRKDIGIDASSISYNGNL